GFPGATRADAVLGLEPRVTDLLLGVNRLDESVRRVIERVEPGPLSTDHRDDVDAVVPDVRPVLPGHPRPVLNLVGEAGSGRHVFAEAVSATLGLELYELDLAALPSDRAERESLLRAVDRDAVLSAFALYVDATATPDDPNILTDVLGERESLVIVGSAAALRLRRGGVTVEVSGATPSAILERWASALGPDLPAGDEVLDVAEQFALGPRSIQRAAAAARQQATTEGRHIATADLVRACRRQAGSALDDLARRIDPRYDWDDIVLPADVADQLHEIAGQVGRRYQVYERWGFGAKHARGRGITVLFAGASGTGKTMAAEVLANDLGLDLYRIDLAGVVSKYIGETEKNLRRLFDAAERSGSVLLFDEADALFGKRTEVRDSHDRYANIEINYLLQRMEDYRGLAILATNMRGLLDHAFLRRLRFILDFPFPDRAGRRAIWARVFPPEAGADIDADALARLEVAGGSIRSIAINAAFFAAEDGDAIGMDHVMRAARREYSKIDKLVVESEFHPRPGAAA
ncbi:MAG: ATP-binding protein, partial [Chloroflexota bacterium]